VVWVDRSGTVTPLKIPEQGYRSLRLSPDGTRVVLDVRNRSQDGRLWVWDLARETLERVTNDVDVSQRPLWTGDGRFLIFSGTYDGQFNLFRQRADGSAAAEPLLPSPNRQLPTAIGPDGDTLFYSEYGTGAVNDDIRVMSLTDRRSKSVLASPFTETHAEPSPDGRLLAYESSESGRAEVYIRPYPEIGDARWQVSTGGGRVPVWGRAGQEIFYVDEQLQIRVVPIKQVGGSVRLGQPQSIPNATLGDAGARTYDVASDGLRLILLQERPARDIEAPSLSIVVGAVPSRVQ
jgi:serine/threonine-protein kinase